MVLWFLVIFIYCLCCGCGDLYDLFIWIMWVIMRWGRVLVLIHLYRSRFKVWISQNDGWWFYYEVVIIFSIHIRVPKRYVFFYEFWFSFYLDRFKIVNVHDRFLFLYLGRYTFNIDNYFMVICGHIMHRFFYWDGGDINEGYLVYRYVA